METVNLNTDQRLFGKAAAAAEWANVAPPDPALIGTQDGYTEYLAIMAQGAQHAKATGQRCPAALTPQLIGLEGRRVEVTDADGTTRRFQVGKSTGWMPCHLEVARCTSSGGPAVYGAPFQSVRIIR